MSINNANNDNYTEENQQVDNFFNNEDEGGNQLENLRKNSQLYREETISVYNFNEVIQMAEKFRMIPADLNPTLI